MPRQLPLNAATQITLDGDGNGTASIGPTAQGEVWLAGFSIAVHCSSNMNEASVRTYTGAGASPAYFRDAGTFGSTGMASDLTQQVATGQQAFAVWSGGDPGATAYMTVTGTRSI